MDIKVSRNAVRPTRVLILEDDLLNALLLEDTLQFAGHEVVGPAKTVPQAMALLTSREIDAAIVDLQIDNHVSFEVGRRLDELGIPWAITTAHAPSVIVPEFAHVARLIKPFTVSALLMLIEELVNVRP
ncbi:MAG: response regulator [Sphingomonadales bacterium]|nr:response regulator [Sphingomonadales bacterium]